MAHWPRAEVALDPGKLARGETATRLYEITVFEWVLFDEANFPEQPRRVIKAASKGSGEDKGGEYNK